MVKQDKKQILIIQETEEITVIKVRVKQTNKKSLKISNEENNPED